eukprot:6064511-Alexandrium_andersonii.AAC.1
MKDALRPPPQRARACSVIGHRGCLAHDRMICEPSAARKLGPRTRPHSWPKRGPATDTLRMQARPPQ